MRVPELISIMDLREIAEVLGLTRDSSLFKSLCLMRSHEGNLIIVPNLKYVVPPYIVISGTLKDTRVVKAINESSSINSIKLESLKDHHQEIALGEVLSIRRPNSNVLVLCDKSGKCYDVSNVTKIMHSNYLGVPVVVFCSKKYCIYLDPIKQKLVKVRSVLLSSHGSTSCLVATDSNTHHIFIWDRYEGAIRNYVLEKQRTVFNRLVCSENLCIAYSESEALAISFNNLYPIPSALRPLTSCYYSDYFIDERYGVIVRSINGELDPIAVTGPAIPCGTINSAPVISTSAGVGVLNDKIWLIVRSGRFLEASAYYNVIAIKYGNKTEFIVFDGSEECSSFANVTKCVVGKGGLTWCLSSSNLVLLNPNRPVEAGIKVLNSKVNSRDYALVTLSPWFPGSSYEISKFVKVVNVIKENRELILKLRPKQLGWSGNVRIMLRTPIISLSESFNLTSTRPKISTAEILNCKYSPDGILKSASSRMCNTLIRLKIVVINPVPEKSILQVFCNDLGKLKSTEYSIAVGPGITEEVLDIRTASKSGKLEISFNLTYDSGDRYCLGKLSIDLNNHLVFNPLKSTDIILTHIGHETLICSKKSNAVLRLTCYDGKVLEGDSCIMISNCLLPAVLELEVQDDLFIWRRYKILSKILEEPVLISISHGESPLNIKRIRSSKGGFTFSNLLVSINTNTNIIEHIDFSFNSPNELLLTYKVSMPSLIIIACGDTVKYIDSKQGNLKINVSNDCIFRGIRILALGPANTVSHILIPFEKLLNALFKLAVKTSLKLRSYLGIM